MKKIMVVEDDIYINKLICEVLKDNYECLSIFDGANALMHFNEFKPDLVLLDLMLPLVNGEDILKSIKDKTKVIILSAKNSLDDKIINLENGANDYITKPFNNDELLARVNVQLRNTTTIISDELEYKELKINLNEYKAYINNIDIKLTKSEFSILALLMKNPNNVYSRGQIFETIWDYDAIGNEESIKVHISNLRSKIKKYSDYNYVETVWGIGFKFNKES